MAADPHGTPRATSAGDEHTAFDPENRATRLLRRLPGARLAESQLERVETLVLTELKHRLDEVSEPAASFGRPAPLRTDAQGAPQAPQAMLQSLLQRSTEAKTPEQANVEFFLSILHQLCPDEARILAALSDGSVYPLIHVLTGSRFGATSDPEVEYVCTVGKNAGVQSADLTPNYIRHLVNLGLVRVDRTAVDDHMRYQILETDTAVRHAVDGSHKQGRRARIVKRSLVISETGKQLWSACGMVEEPIDGKTFWAKDESSQ